VDLALGCFARIVGIRDGRIAFDLPAAQVSQAQLQALYAHADGSAAALPTLGSMGSAAPQLLPAPAAEVITCR
jgi:phosphonate transport system ATP-binding protein